MKAIIKSDSLIASQAINGKPILLRQIRNLMEDINMLAKDIENVKFVYCKRSANALTDKITKETIRSYTQNIVSNE